MKFRVRYYKMDEDNNHALSEIEVEGESFLDALQHAHQRIDKMILRSNKWVSSGIIGIYEVE